MTDTIARLNAALESRYVVEREIGAGGMAVVYQARDLKHHRAVAIKVLRQELAASLGTERFLREIEVAAGLQHPHIVPVYDSGEAGSDPTGRTYLYYVMPFVEGESLRDRLNREGRIPLDQAITIGREVAGALAYAHAHDIVHRDIKPENIMLSGGHAVVADFGIARAIKAASGETRLTGVGLAVGTPAYMSPEQATASDEVGCASDQYSLACVVYEMLAGKPAFSGPTMQAVITQSLTAPRPHLRTRDRTIPEDVDQAIVRALAQDPGQRFSTVTELGNALGRSLTGSGIAAARERRRLKLIAFALPSLVALLAAGWIVWGPSRAGAVVSGAESIAVLPFSTSGPGVDLLGEGMVDLLSTNLNATGGIRTVEPRTVLLRWKKQGGHGGADLEGALALGRAVKSRAVLLGSIVATGSSVRLTANLYGGDGKQLAGVRVDGQADSVLSLVDNLSVALVREIWRSREPVPSLRVTGLTTSSLDAMRSYLEGEQFYRRSEWDSAQTAFGRAVDQDSTFALAHYRLAMSLGWVGGYGTPRARQASDAAARFSGRLPARERAIVVAYHLFSQGSMAAADSMRKYVATYPEDADGWYLLGESQYHTKALIALDPKSLQAPFERVLALDSSLTPAIIHPIELTLIYRDSVGYARYLRMLGQAGASEEVDAFRMAGRFARDGQIPDSGAAARLLKHPGAAAAAVSSIFYFPTATSDSVMSRIEAFHRLAPPSDGPNGAFAQTVVFRSLALGGVGRFEESARVGDSLMKAKVQQGAVAYIAPAMVGTAPQGYGQEFLRGFLAAPLRDPPPLLIKAEILLGRGERASAGKLIDSMLALDTTRLSRQFHGLFLATQGWKLLLAGDTTAGLRNLRDGLRQSSGLNSTVLTGPLRLQLATTLAARPETREEGIRRLRYGFDNDYGLIPITYFALGKAYELAGEREAALDAYGTFVRLWGQADSAAQPRVKEARRAIAELAGEKR